MKSRSTRYALRNTPDAAFTDSVSFLLIAALAVRQAGVTIKRTD